MGEGSPVNQSSLLGKFLPLKGKEAGGDYEIHDSHKIWNRKYTEHYETGIVIHVTSGNVQHANLNLSEVHATANVLTMHMDITPLQVHLNQGFAGIQFHYEPDKRIRKYHYHGGHVINVDDHFATEAHVIELHATEQLGLMGTMTLEADRDITLVSRQSVVLESSSGANKASLSLSGTDGTARIYSKLSTIVSGDTKTRVLGGDSTILLKQSSLELQSGSTTVSLSPGKLETNGTDTKLNGRVTLGNPAVSGIVTKEIPRRLEPARVANVGQQIAAAMARLPPARP